MQNVKVDRTAVLERVKTNREQHRKIVLEAMEGYRTAVIKELDRMLSDAKEGKRIRTRVELIAPQDHTREYDTVIDMLQMSVENEVTLTSVDFMRYVRDEWEWQHQFLEANAAYSEVATQALRSLEPVHDETDLSARIMRQLQQG